MKCIEMNDIITDLDPFWLTYVKAKYYIYQVSSEYFY
jgi:hypothetical protein